MMQIDRFSFIKGCLSIAACCTLAGCVDDKYDLTDIDTTTRVTVNNLTVPVNLNTIKLDDVVELDDNENISKIMIDGKECYALLKDGDINTSNFNIGGIHVASIPINSLQYSIVPPYNNASARKAAAFDVNLPDNLPMSSYHFNMDNIDPALLQLKDVKTSSDILLNVMLSVNPEFIGDENKIVFKNVAIKLPWGLISDDTRYDMSTGIIVIPEIPVGSDGYARFSFKASGLELGERGVVNNHSIDISDEIGIISAAISFDINSFNLPQGMIEVKADFDISAFDIASFSGKIDYHMDNIDIAPISLSDLPDFLDSPETEIRIANPTILVNINNPVGRYGVAGYGKIRLTSNFDGGASTVAESDLFSISESGASLTFGKDASSDNYIHFNGLTDILVNPNAGGLPQTITVNLENIRFAGDAVDFPLGTIESAHGDYTFTAPLGFESPSKVVYETTEDGWNSEDLDKLFINHIKLKAVCSTNLPVGLTLKVNPVDKNGNLIPVKEDSSNFEVEPMSQGKEVSLSIEGANGPIHSFDGIRFRAVISQDGDNTSAIGPDLDIKLSDLRICVDGYYETDF
ncbi:MAG: hypothetical protein J5995_09600 [Muribaculaceae bacterium]|nr:hypothetical protein [Muribaculaceae bacterium]